jgi:hypothetical protein
VQLDAESVAGQVAERKGRLESGNTADDDHETATSKLPCWIDDP